MHLPLRAAKILLVTAAISLVSVTALAELPNRSPEELQEGSTHVVSGTIQAMYSYEHAEGEHVTTRHVLELRIDKVEKGEGLEPGTVVYCKVWRAKERPLGWVGPSGHSIPKTKQVRVFLTRAADGSFDVLLPNGLQPLKEG